MTRKFEWHLRLKLAEQQIYKTTDLGPLLAEHGVRLSREQVYRLVTSPPQRLNMEVLDALCEILSCTPNDLITFEAVATKQAKAVGSGLVTEIDSLRPVPAKLARPDKE